MRAKTKIEIKQRAMWGALFFLAVACVYLTGCQAAATWLAAPAEAAGQSPCQPGGAPSPTNADVIVSGGSRLIGAFNPFAGYASGAIGRLLLGNFMSGRAPDPDDEKKS